MSVLDIAMTVADTASSVLPAPKPTQQQFERCKIISHRGEHDNIAVAENTLAAFHAASAAGVWGIECDIRFTADGVPVICHDAAPARVFGHGEALASMTFTQLRREFPQIPSLSEVVATFGGKLHLMLEVKTEPWPQPQAQQQALHEILRDLQPAEDYHILSLDTGIFDRLDFVPPSARLPVAELNVGAMSRYALETGCAGLGGHYVLLGRRLQARHAAVSQQLGVGFPASQNCFYKQLSRGIEWVFSNDAVKLERIRQSEIRAASA